MTDNLAHAAALLRARSTPASGTARLPPTRRATSRGCCGSGRATRLRCSTGGAASSARGSRRRPATACRSICSNGWTPAPEAACPLTLVQAVLKGDKMDDVVRDATMMGVAAIEPMVTAHTIARTRDGSGRGTERWRRVAVVVREAVPPRDGAGDRQSTPYSRMAGDRRRRPAADSGGAVGRSGGSEQSLHLLEDHAPAALALLVGPEGGWSAEEREDAEKAGCIPVTLGALTLRADAVAVAAIAMVRFALRDL